MSHSVLEPKARELFEKGAEEVTIYPVADPRGERWTIRFKVGAEEYSIASKREETRTWASINTAVHWLKGFGIKNALLKIA